MEDLSPESISYFFLEEDYPEKLQAELDAVFRERVAGRFDNQFGFSDKMPIIGTWYYDEDRVREIADKRGQRSSFADEGLNLDAEFLLKEYNDRASGSTQGTLTGDTFAQMELEWISDRLEIDDSIQGGLRLDDDIRIGYDNGRYAAISGEPVDPEDVRELAEITDEEISFTQVSRGDGSASPHHYSPPNSLDSHIRFDHELPYGRLTANEGNSRLKARSYDEQIPEIADVIQS